ncbi:MAG: peptidase S8 [Deltaproteobacteria bacterium]|nr:MAG: peptidase S8 [Deltaproteobacteria bacterium]
MRQVYKTLGALVLGGLGLWWGLAPQPAERHVPVPAEVPVPDGGGRLIVDLVDGADEADLSRVGRVIDTELRWVHPLSVDEALAIGEVEDLSAAIEALRDHPLVEHAEAEQVIDGVPEPTPLALDALSPRRGFPNDPLYDKQWHLRAMGADQAWRTTPRGRGVVVAVLDTGVTQVEDLQGTRVLPGVSFVPGEPDARDLQGHGTHVAGTIAQTTHNGIGVAGVAPEATILPIKVLSRHGSGSSAWIAAGIDHAADEGAQVINLSLGSAARSAVIETAIRKATERGVIVVAAAGNSGRKGVHYPGALKETIGVAALGPSGEPAPYSSWGKGVDLAAPGGDKRLPDGGVLQNTVGPQGQGSQYASFQGTSMATPHVAGAAAVLLSTGLSPDEVRARLLDGARGSGWDPHVGNGALDLVASLTGLAPRGSPFRALLGAVIALLVGRLAGASIRWTAVGAITAAVTAGGLFMLAWLPLPAGAWLTALSVGVLDWPAAFGLGFMGRFPLWLSAIVPGLIALFAGAFRPTRALSLGLAVGVGAHLLHGAITGSLSPWALGSLGPIWLVANATACVLIGMALAGAEKLDREAS